MSVSKPVAAKISQPLKWHGGKHYLAPWIISHFPKHTHYVEPYFGGGAVLFAKPLEWIEGHSEVVNDLNGELMDFWDILKSPVLFGEFKCRLEMTPFSEEEFRRARCDFYDDDKFGRAVSLFIRYRQSRQGLGKDFATLSRNRTRRGMNEQVSSWLSAIEGLPEAHERLKRVVILNRDALEVIRQQDGENTFFYLDPPYLHETRFNGGGEYEHEMTAEQHQRLLEALSGIQGKFLLSGYHSTLYDSFAKQCGWNVHEREIDNKASSKAVKDKKIECLWSNL